MTTHKTITLAEPPKDHHSHSAFSTAALCGAKYEFKYIAGTQERASSSLVFGSVVHDALEFASREQLVKGSGRPRAAVIAAFAADGLAIEIARQRKQTNQEIEWKRIHKGAPLDTLESLKDDCVNTIITYETEYGKDTQPILVEQKFRVELEGVDVPLEGYIDLVNKPGIVRDYKTTAKKMADGAVLTSEQLTLYQIALEDDGIPVTGLELHVIVRKAGGAAIQVLKAPPRTAAQKAAYIDNAQKAARLIAARIFPKVNNSMICSWCGYRRTCHADWYPERPDEDQGEGA
jgi:CRISPR/Cas system-associated exonuclease Cas4 (RecB family)